MIKSVKLRLLREMFGYSLFVNNSNTDFYSDKNSVRADYKEWLKTRAEKDVKDMVSRYVVKNTSKLSSLVQSKGEYESAEAHGTLRGWGFGGNIVFKFADGTGFTVYNQAVQKYSYTGTPFTQFPTTFHDVTFPDGAVKKMVPEKNMNEVWATQEKAE